MKHIWKRLTSTTPKFFRKLQVFGASLAAMCVSIEAIPKVSARISEIAENGIVAGAIIIAVAQFACTNVPEPPKQ